MTQLKMIHTTNRKPIGVIDAKLLVAGRSVVERSLQGEVRSQGDADASLEREHALSVYTWIIVEGGELLPDVRGGHAQDAVDGGAVEVIEPFRA